MRKAIAVIAALGLTVAAAPGAGAHGRHLPTRKAVLDYDRPNGARAGALTVGVFATMSGNIYSFKTFKGEDHADLKIVDDLGGAVSASVYYKGDHVTDFCGSLDNLRFDGGRRLVVVVWAGQCFDPSGASVATTGKIKATFSDRL